MQQSQYEANIEEYIKKSFKAWKWHAAKTRNEMEIVVDADGVEDIEDVRAHDNDVNVSEDDPAW